jgi:predicted phosphoribosyltransferase
VFVAAETVLFRDRAAAGAELARMLAAYAGRPDVVVYGLPRGGVPVAAPVAHALGAPLDVLVVRKLGVPGQPELAMGAIASGGVRVLNHDVLDRSPRALAALETVTGAERRELERRERAYRGDRPAVEPAGRVTVVVDDGLATGSTMLAAVQALRQREPARVVVAVPVGSPDVCARLRTVADEVVCARMPDPLYAVGYWYDDFGQTTDAEVRALLDGERIETVFPLRR